MPAGKNIIPANCGAENTDPKCGIKVTL